MKRKNLIIFAVFVVLISCGTLKSLFSVVSNKFPKVDEPENATFETWNKSNLYILRVEVEKKSKIKYEENNKIATELTDYSLKDYSLLIKPEWNNEKVTEEVYLYLSNFEEQANSGSVIYMSSMPLRADVSKLIFCNGKFVSTYGINHVMTGKWEKNDSIVKVKLADRKNKLDMEGKFMKEEAIKMIEFTHVTHPKPMTKDDDSLIEFKDVFEVDPNKELESDESTISGIRFFQNTERTFVHPDWNKLGKKFDYKLDSLYYSNNLEKLKITEVMIRVDDWYDVFFKINDSLSQATKDNVIGYKR